MLYCNASVVAKRMRAGCATETEPWDPLNNSAQREAGGYQIGATGGTGSHVAEKGRGCQTPIMLIERASFRMPHIAFRQKVDFTDEPCGRDLLN